MLIGTKYGIFVNQNFEESNSHSNTTTNSNQRNNSNHMNKTTKEHAMDYEKKSTIFHVIIWFMNILNLILMVSN